MSGKRVAMVAAGVVFSLAAVAGAYVVYRWIEKGPPGGPAASQGFEPMEAVQIVEAVEKTWYPTADLVGTVIAKRSVVVRNEVAGVVRFVGFDSGSVVEPKQEILRLDDTVDQADMKAANASVAVADAAIADAETRIALAGRELERVQEASAGGATVEAEMDRAESALKSATAEKTRREAELDLANARVAQVQARLDKLTITSPFRARAGMRTVQEGQYLAEGSDVVALQELTDTIYLDFAIPQEYAPRVRVGTTVMATGRLLGPEPVKIEVVAVDATVNYDTRNLRVRSVVDNTSGALVPGMFVQVRVPIDEPRPYVMVPSTAVRRAPYGDLVYVIAPDEAGAMRAQERLVSLGQTVGEDVIVLKGLGAGERIAAAGSFKLHHGALVMVGPPPGAEGQGGEPGGAQGG
ncbi:MAG: efflux RND transporter periplasmic adaptor subunit [Phycisphaeraceae bacterium]|nr:efflux RND transporter periplasmic adaptor subunit [Phycisphaeraceae bacterium]